jgi:hypothetical protein
MGDGGLGIYLSTGQCRELLAKISQAKIRQKMALHRPVKLDCIKRGTQVISKSDIVNECAVPRNLEGGHDTAIVSAKGTMEVDTSAQDTSTSSSTQEAQPVQS